MPFQSKVERSCSLCSEIIRAGSLTRPVMLQPSDTTLKWVHSECVSPTDERIPVCKHWKSKGKCMFMVKCQFRHPQDQINTEMRNRRRHGTWGRKRVYNEGRVSAIRRWLLHVFGREYLLSGSGIVDVAGGKGEFSFEALNLNGIPSTVFDPRPLDLYRYKRKLQFGFYHRNEVLGSYNHVPKPIDGAAPSLPTHIRGFFQMFDSCVQGSIFPYIESPPQYSHEQTDYRLLPLVLRSSEEFAAGMEEARGTNWTIKGLTHEGEDEGEQGEMEDNTGDNPRESQYSADSSVCSSSCSYNSSSTGRAAEPGVEIVSWEEARRIVQDCSVLVGMHPDQAAEHLIDFALLNGKPFAVVPCCVYNRQFPHRLLASGSGGYVKSYGEFVEYLLRKDPGIIPLQMDFEGKNILLYHMGGREPLGDPALAMPHICKGSAVSEMWWALSSNQEDSASMSTGSRFNEHCGCSGRNPEDCVSTRRARRKQKSKSSERSNHPSTVAENNRFGDKTPSEDRLVSGMQWLLAAAPGGEDGCAGCSGVAEGGDY